MYAVVTPPDSTIQDTDRTLAIISSWLISPIIRTTLSFVHSERSRWTEKGLALNKWKVLEARESVWSSRPECVRCLLCVRESWVTPFEALEELDIADWYSPGKCSELTRAPAYWPICSQSSNYKSHRLSGKSTSLGRPNVGGNYDRPTFLTYIISDSGDGEPLRVDELFNIRRGAPAAHQAIAFWIELAAEEDPRPKYALGVILDFVTSFSPLSQDPVMVKHPRFDQVPAVNLSSSCRQWKMRSSEKCRWYSDAVAWIEILHYSVVVPHRIIANVVDWLGMSIVHLSRKDELVLMLMLQNLVQFDIFVCVDRRKYSYYGHFRRTRSERKWDNRPHRKRNSGIVSVPRWCRGKGACVRRPDKRASSGIGANIRMSSFMRYQKLFHVENAYRSSGRFNTRFAPAAAGSFAFSWSRTSTLRSEKPQGEAPNMSQPLHVIKIIYVAVVLKKLRGVNVVRLIQYYDGGLG
ncbi:hypothetical protein BJY52DRAFT_1227993 [Lactarius psammicola]|nr:hypothetical protein BJY52DRAFT_1227993 [Lactarius psammicola]